MSAHYSKPLARLGKCDSSVGQRKNMKHNTNMISHVKKGFLYSFIVFLAASAIIAITSILAGRFGNLEIKVLITTTAIAVASICSLCCSAYTNQSKKNLPSIAGISLAGVSAILLCIAVWMEIDSAGYWKTTAILSVFAIAFAHSLALLVVRLRPIYSWLRLGTTINIFILATIISGMIEAGSAEEGIFKLITVLAILVALETLVIPILGRLAKPESNHITETLSLAKREDGMYEDKRGHLYEVNEMSNK